MPTFFDVHAIAEELANGQLVICSNQRLASRLQAAYAFFCGQHHGHSVVDAPRVYSLQGWIEASWQQLLAKAHPLTLSHTVLTSAQQQNIWEQIIEASGLALLRPAATAQQAVSAYNTLVLWRQDINSKKLREDFLKDEDATTFLAWADAFESRCRALNCIPAVKVPPILLGLYQSGELKSSGPVLLIGFESLSPLEQSLLEQLGPLTHYQSDKTGSIKTLACENPQKEIHTAATWAKQQLKNTPGQTIAVVIPDLAQQRGRIQRIFQEVFEPDFSDPEVSRKSLPFNISAAYALIEAPVIAAAIDALSLNLHEIDVGLCHAIIDAPFYMLDADDETVISRLAGKLSDLRQSQITSSLFRQLAERINAASADTPWPFAAALQNQASLLRASPKKSTAEYWSGFFAENLALLGWPGKRRLDSEEYQQVMQWQSLIEDFCSLDSVLGEVTYGEALSVLKGLVSRQLFQPQSAESSLQVLGILEAAGLQFDHLWLLSMSDQQWPASPNPNFLLPFSLQREHSMPHATAERELEFATHLLERFISSADNIIASHANFIDGNASRPSSLIVHYPITTELDILGRPLKSLLPTIEIRRRYLESAKIENFAPGNAPQVKEQDVVRGGSYLFASQSACPFRSFARHRLHIEALKKPEIGLNAADRGTLLHRALELIWAKLKGLDGLLALDKSSEEALCLSTADYALSDFESKKTLSFGPRFRSLEKQRMAVLLQGWLQAEKQRAHFTVQSLEARHTFRYAQLELQTRIDRIDKLDDGSLIIIDYKTSKNVNVNRWWGERPEDPQLPLYHMLLANTENISGVAFAKVHIEGHELLGVGSESSTEKNTRFTSKFKSKAGVEDWQQLTTHWQRVLESIARDFINGVADVDPKNPATTCMYCDLSMVCRVDQIIPSENIDASA